MRSTGRIALAALLWFASASCGARTTETATPPPAENAPVEEPAPEQVSSFRHEAAGIRFAAPQGWRSETDTDRMSFTAPDGTLTVLLFTAPDEDMAAVADEIDRQIGEVVANSTADGELENESVNGIPVTTQKGTGQVDGKPVDWTVRVFEAKQRVLVFAFGVPGSFDKYYPDLDAFVHSVERL